MRVDSEIFTILANPAKKEITLLIAGSRITFDVDEARSLTVQLVSSIQSVHNQRTIDNLLERADEPPPPIVRAADDRFAPSSTAGDDAPQSTSSLLKRPAEATSPKVDAKAETKSGPKSAAKADTKAVIDDKKAANKLRTLLKGLAKDGRIDGQDEVLELRHVP